MARNLIATITLLIISFLCPFEGRVFAQSAAPNPFIEDIVSGKTITPLRRLSGQPPTAGRAKGIVAYPKPDAPPFENPALPGKPVNSLYESGPGQSPQAMAAVGPNVEPRGPTERVKSFRELLDRPLLARTSRKARPVKTPRVKAKAVFCVDNSCDRVVLAQNVTEPLPIASITKLLTAMTVLDTMNLKRVVRIQDDIRRVPRHRVGIRPGDLITVEDLLHGMLIESGNDCAEALARAYPKGRDAFISKMNQRAKLIGANKTRIYTPSGLDMTITLGRKNGRVLAAKHPNVASAEDVALIAKRAFEYPHIRRISSMKTHRFKTRNKRPRRYLLRTNDKLLHRKLPVAGAKTGYTNLAGRCIVAHFKDEKRDYTVVVLNTKRHFREAEKIFKWACKTF